MIIGYARVSTDGQSLECPRRHEFAYLVARPRGFPRVRFHDLRRTYATQLLARLGGHPQSPDTPGRSG
jgi:integrase